jgi:hypothetical protein
LFTQAALKTTTGEPVEVQRAGEQNTDAGPDFFNATIRIDDTTWAGNVELHLKSSAWNQHRHQHDKDYQNIILHVVYEDDEPVYASNGRLIPTLELKGLFDETLWLRYNELMLNSSWVPCDKQLKTIDSFTIDNWLERIVIERLERKADGVQQLLDRTNNHWEESFYIALARNFGFKLNALPFEMLAQSLPQIYLAKHKDNLFQLEALLFGQAGFLDEAQDEYQQQLHQEYGFLRKKYGLTPIEKHLWKFLRLRPQNFPTIRLAQFAVLVQQSLHLFSKVLECEKLHQLSVLFETQVSTYWLSHYSFGKTTKPITKTFSQTSIDNIIINTIVPFLFVYGQKQGDEQYKDRAMAFLSGVKAEKNTIINHWETAGIKAESALQSQGLLQLKNDYCAQKHCLSCGIGHYLLKSA